MMDDNSAEKLIKSKGIKIVHVNIHSIVNKIDQIRDTFTGLDIIVISETWLTPAIADAYVAIPGYNLVRLDRMSSIKKRGGGVDSAYMSRRNSVRLSWETLSIYPTKIMN